MYAPREPAVLQLLSFHIVDVRSAPSKDEHQTQRWLNSNVAAAARDTTRSPTCVFLLVHAGTGSHLLVSPKTD